MGDANRQRSTLTVVAMTLYGIAIFSAGGCVMQSTYDAALQEGISTRAELVRALEEQKVLTRQVSELELSNADAVREAEASVTALRQAQDEADHERRQLEQQIAKLKQKVAQVTKQHHSLRYELTVAKENGAALQELIDVYQRKVRDGVAAVPATDTPVHKPFDPSTIPLPQDLPAPPVVAQPQQTPAPTPTQTPAVSPSRVPQSPPDEGWLSSIKNWLVSLWHSVFS